MTLSRFLRDYVFLPLADMRVAGTRHTLAQYVLAIVATMALCGLWHGAGWNFVLWGVMHGVAIVVALAWRRYAIRLPDAIGWLLTILFFLLSGIVFRAGTLDAAWHLYAGLLVLPDAKLLGRSWILGLAIACATLLPSSRELCTRINKRPRMIVAVALGLVCIAITVLLGGDESYEFIYFKF
jgi:alginate O-acetyltransferase complex protein AlgI